MISSDLKIFKDIPTLYTDRLILRKITKADLADVYEYASDPLVSRYLLWSPHTDVGYTRLYLKTIASKYRRGEFFDWGIEYNGKMIGTCGFTSFNLYDNSAEIGYVLNSSYWYLGIAKEAAKRIIDFGFNVLSLNRIEARFISSNIHSRRVAEKIGMTYEGEHKASVYAKGAYVDVGVCAIIVDNFRNKQK